MTERPPRCRACGTMNEFHAAGCLAVGPQDSQGEIRRLQLTLITREAELGRAEAALRVVERQRDEWRQVASDQVRLERDRAYCAEAEVIRLHRERDDYLGTAEAVEIQLQEAMDALRRIRALIDYPDSYRGSTPGFLSKFKLRQAMGRFGEIDLWPVSE